MAKMTAQDRWLAAQTRLKHAEQAAGVEAALRELNDRNAYIATMEKHCSDQRQIVFEIPDLAHRCEVIRAYREVHKARREKELAYLQDLYKRANDGGEGIRRKALWVAGITGVSLVLIGSYAWGITGALIGTVVAMLVGFHEIRSAERHATADVEEAKSEIKESVTFLDEFGTDGIYSEIEAETGQPDPDNGPALWPAW